MKTIINSTNLAIKDAALALKKGFLVAFPTETVYGLGADATNKNSVNRIYNVKGRPKELPLIVHISSIDLLDKWVSQIPEYAIKLARNYWPGPMTLVLPRTDLAQDYITGSQKSVAIRIPSHNVALGLLSEFEKLGGVGVVAPSANRFGKVSPTSPQDVVDELQNKLEEHDQILGSGDSEIGIESTIIDCLGDNPIVLRPGFITVQMVEALLSMEVGIFKPGANLGKFPGMSKNHYSPDAQVFLNGTPQPGDGLVALGDIPTPNGVVRLASPMNDIEFARVIYKSLRLGDQMGLKRIVVILNNQVGLNFALFDRLSKSTFTK